MDVLFQKESLGKELGISLATVNNWIKTQVIPLPDFHNRYSRETFNFILNSIKNSPTRLNSRANRKQSEKTALSFSGLGGKKRKELLSGLVRHFNNSGFTFDEGVLALSFSLLCSAGLISRNWKFNDGSILDKFLSNWFKQARDYETVKNLFFDFEIENKDDDLLGAFYQSVQNISRRSNTGSYYTPSCLLKGIKIKPDCSVLDPCCGSGGILLNVLSKDHNPENIYARDTDDIALKICYINLTLFFNDKNIKPNISKQDITIAQTEDFSANRANGANRKFDYIITNPPWGSKYSNDEKRALINNYPELSSSETFSIALYNSYKKLKNNGELYFFLPYSFLNVAAHKNIRKIIFNKDNTDNSISIKLLGKAFKGVLSESILLNIKNVPSDGFISIEDIAGKQYEIRLKKLSPPDFIISANINTEDSIIIDKMYNTTHKTLKGSAIFALGIVLGDNKKYLCGNQCGKNFEPIYRGKEIERYGFLKNEYFIDYKPELYQQAAPVEYYRQKKIVYKFINDSIICVLDTNNSLILNSANLLISYNYPMETIISLIQQPNLHIYLQKKI